jgi:hypothetical protein
MDFQISSGELILLSSSVIGLSLSLYLTLQNYALKVIIKDYQYLLLTYEEYFEDTKILIEDLQKEIKEQDLENQKN